MWISRRFIRLCLLYIYSMYCFEVHQYLQYYKQSGHNSALVKYLLAASRHVYSSLYKGVLLVSFIEILCRYVYLFSYDIALDTACL